MASALMARHLAAMCSGPLSVPVRYTGPTGATVSTRGLFNHDADLIDDMTGGEIKRDARVLTVPVGRLPGARQNSRVTVDGATFEVRAVLPTEDGQLVRYLLAPVSGT